VAPKDPNALAEAMERLIGDADLRANMGRSAREHAKEKFDSVLNANRLCMVLEETIKRGRN
jgi:glycosyltransferase involved in cell wall biosynthesis